MQCASHTQRLEILGLGLRGPDRDLPWVMQLTGKRQVQTSEDPHRQAWQAWYPLHIEKREDSNVKILFPPNTVAQDGAGAQPLTSCLLFD